jgi:hypothetical protein
MAADGGGANSRRSRWAAILYSPGLKTRTEDMVPRRELVRQDGFSSIEVAKDWANRWLQSAHTIVPEIELFAVRGEFEGYDECVMSDGTDVPSLDEVCALCDCIPLNGAHRDLK